MISEEARLRRRGVSWVLGLALLLVIVSAVPVLAAEEEGAVGASTVTPPSAAQVAAGMAQLEAEEAERRRELQSPQAAAERKASRTRYSALPAGDARELLLSTFSEQLAALNSDPGRFLSDVKLESASGEFAATVSVEGDGSLLESSVPVRAENEEGDLKKVNLDLESTAGGFEPVNPLVELAIPRAADRPIEIGDEGLAVVPVGNGSPAQEIKGEDVYFPNVRQDTDLLVSPISTGVEIFDLLWSIESPEALEYRIELPAKAALRESGTGGAEIVQGGDVIAEVAPPHAVDAQGTPVPATLRTEGATITVEVVHRSADLAYPILVDPAIHENYEGTWWSGSNLDSLNIPGIWSLSGDTTMNWYLAGTSCLPESKLCAPSGRGLYVQAMDGWMPANTYLQWSYTVPGTTSYIPSILPEPSVSINPFYRNDNTCGIETYPQPHDYDGSFDAAGNWTYLEKNRARWYNYDTHYTKAKGVAFGLSTGASGVTLPCNRDIVVGGVAIRLDDPENPTLSSVTGFPTGWIKAGQSFTVTANISDPGLGVQNVKVFPAGRPEIAHVSPGSQCPGTKVSPCPASRSAQFALGEALFDEGEKKVQVSGYDPTGKVSGTYETMVRVDRQAPTIDMAGSLAVATHETNGDGQDPKKWEELSRPLYELGVQAKDGSTATPESKRSGVKRLEVFVDGVPAEGSPWSLPSCAASSCEIGKTIPVELAKYGTGKHTIKVLAFDWLEQKRERTLEFEYFPATGDKDEYVMERFPLPDGSDPEDPEALPWPEISVNVANGNVLFEQRDVDIEGPAVDLEVERVYNSLLPQADNTEWGDGWTLAQTPDLDPVDTGGTPAADQADIVDASGTIEDTVALPTETGATRFDPGLQATITKETGGYELDDESGETAGSLIFDSTGRAQSFELEGDDTEVDYAYEEGELSEIAVSDPNSSNVAPPKPPPVPAQGKPTFASSSYQTPTVADVARDAEGHLWAVDKGSELRKFTPGGALMNTYYGNVTGMSMGNAIAIDGRGNLLIADVGKNKVLIVEERLGLPKGSFGSFEYPSGIAVDRQGNIWVTDLKGRVQKFTPAGVLLGSYGTKGSGAGQLNAPKGLDVAPNGEIWIADSGNHRIAVFNESGAFVKNIGSLGSGLGQLNTPLAVDFDDRGIGWVIDSGNGRVQGFTPQGVYHWKFGAAGSGNGQFQFGSAAGGLVADASGRFWATDPGNSRLQKWETPNYIPDYTPALGSSAFSATGSVKRPGGIALSPQGTLWVADSGNNRLQRFTASGTSSGVVGSLGSAAGQLNRPVAVAIDKVGNAWVADAGNNRIQKFNQEGKFELQAGSSGAAAGQFSSPEGIAVGPDGRIWVSDTKNSRLQIFDATGKFEQAIGGPGAGPGQFAEPKGLDFGPSGDVYVADSGNNRIQKLDGDGSFIAEFGSAGSGNGQLQQPVSLEVDENGLAWVIDSGNDRVQVFAEDGGYLRKFGTKGTGTGQFELASPSGLAVDEAGRIWIADTDNNRIQKWVTPAFQASELVQAQPEVPNDPSVEIDASEDLVSSVEGAEAGAHSYEHDGDDLVAHAGPEGETKYEYNGAGLLTKVELPNGTVATVTYHSVSNRAETVTVDPAGPDPAKVTSFSYDDANLKTTVERQGSPKVDYYFDELGAVFKLWNAVKPPEVVLSGTLWFNKETAAPINTGLHNLEVQADSAHGIASIAVLDGDVLVSEKRCEQNPEAPGTECLSEMDEWVVETAELEPGIHALEVLVYDHLGQVTGSRFWVNIPFTPPPDPDAPKRPTFSEIKSFRKAFGLDLDLNPVSQEQLLNDRIYDLLAAWGNPNTPAGEVARMSAERWGVPLRPIDVAEMEYREWFIEVNGRKIDEWGFANHPGSYAGYQIDHAGGGLVRVGFTESQALRLSEMLGGLTLAAEDRFTTFATPPTYSKASLESKEEAIVAVMDSDPVISAVVNEVGLSENGASVFVGASDVTAAKGAINQLLGSLNGIDVVQRSPAQPDSCSDNPNRNRDSGRMLAGDAFWIDHAHLSPTPEFGCGSAGFGAFKYSIGTTPSGDVPKEPWLLTAGHFGGVSEVAYRLGDPTAARRANIRKYGAKIGRVGISLATQGSGRIDASAVKLNSSGLMPFRRYGRKGNHPRFDREGAADLGYVLCHNGATTAKVKCGTVVGFRYIKLSSPRTPNSVGVIIVKNLETSPGDSGGPVWQQGTQTAIDLHSASLKVAPYYRYVTPLVTTHYGKGKKIPGALSATLTKNMHLAISED